MEQCLHPKAFLPLVFKVGKNWRGHKLVASWPKGAVSNWICKDFDDQLFSAPLSEEKLKALRLAAKIVLLRPGDVYFFSGSTAHTALCVSEGLGGAKGLDSKKSRPQQL